MNNDYYIDVVTKNILSTLSGHISSAVSGQLQKVMELTTAQLEIKFLTILEKLNKNLNDSIEESRSILKNQSVEITNLKTELNHIKQKIDAANTTQLDSLAKSVEEQLKTLPEKFQNSTVQLEKQMQKTNEIMDVIRGSVGEIKRDTAASMESTVKELIGLLQSMKSVTGETIKDSLKAEIKKIETSFSANKAEMLTILRTIFESELRGADLLAQRAQNNKVELRDKLSAIEQMFGGSSQS